MPYDIMDKRTRELPGEINVFLSDSIRARSAVGCFFLASSEVIAEHISQEVNS
jgi:hypothetical protein